jgi:predicted nucleic acid-binding Zn ribbon protein
MNRKCVICGHDIPTDRNHNTVTCSPDCTARKHGEPARKKTMCFKFCSTCGSRDYSYERITL